MSRPHWPLNLKAQEISKSDREWFVLVSLGQRHSEGRREFVVPGDHVSAATWISHESLRTESGIRRASAMPEWTRREFKQPSSPGISTVGIYCCSRAGYDASGLLPPHYRKLALTQRVGLPPGHRWVVDLPGW
jgi:hypothetical protein